MTSRGSYVYQQQKSDSSICRSHIVVVRGQLVSVEALHWHRWNEPVTCEVTSHCVVTGVMFPSHAADSLRQHCVTGIQRFAFFFSSRRRHTRSLCDWSSDVCS